MIGQLEKYRTKLAADGSADLSRAALMARDDRLLFCGAEELRLLGETLIEQLDVVSLVIAAPSLPLLDLLLGRLSAETTKLVPQDTETRTFLHDIPIVRRNEFSFAESKRLVEQLGQRKGVLVEGVGILTTGAVTVEQAYINYSSIYHALFIKLLLMLLTDRNPPSRSEIEALEPLWNQLRTDIPMQVGDLLAGPLSGRERILAAMDQIGRRTVQLKLVDSFFGNLSVHNDRQLYISQTGASLDALNGCIDRVPDDDSSTAGMTASSELIAHRAICAQTGSRVVLHGHPKFSVLLSLNCREISCKIEDCWKNCDKIRYLDHVPVVAGEIGAGGIARNIPPVIGGGIAVVYGHGVFATGQDDFRQPLEAMIKLENWCRREYTDRLFARYK